MIRETCARVREPVRPTNVGIRAATVFVLTWTVSISADDYDPLRVPDAAKVETIDLSVHDSMRKRDIPVRVYRESEAKDQTAAPVVLFSHGLGGSRTGSAYLGNHWAKRGYIAVFLQHPGSDDSVWKDEPLGKRTAAMQKAASARNLLLRLQDVPAVLDQLTKWNADSGHALHGALDLKRVGMSGHSFGAQTAQAVAGQSMALFAKRYVDPRIKASVVMSPSSPRGGDNPKAAFGGVKLPWLLMTGTKDTSPIGGQTVESRLAVFPALPAGDKYELVLHNAEHSAFSERALSGDQEARNPNHHRVILALSTAFWDAFLKENVAAKGWLNGEGAKSVLQPEDRWQRK